MTIDPTVVVAAIGALASGLGVAFRIIYNDLQKQLAQSHKREDYWRSLALMGTDLADKADKVAERATRKLLDG